MDLQDQIRTLAQEKKALILAHNYQNPEIQDIADVTGDSLELARVAADNEAEIILFCGVHFMAESASILSPDKKVILPSSDAGCPMADMATAEGVRALKAQHPEAKVVSYINSSAAVKAESDVICTSSNAVRIVQRIDAEKIIFLPDRNLGRYVQRFTDKEMILWDGYCPVHNDYSAGVLQKLKDQHPGVAVMVHPECNAEVIDLADHVFSTGEMVRFVHDTDLKEIIVGTETGMIHKLQRENPSINYIAASPDIICKDMKLTTLPLLFDALKNEHPVITVDNEIAKGARRALQRMLELS